MFVMKTVKFSGETRGIQIYSAHAKRWIESDKSSHAHKCACACRKSAICVHDIDGFMASFIASYGRELFASADCTNLEIMSLTNNVVFFVFCKVVFQFSRVITVLPKTLNRDLIESKSYFR